MANDPAEKVLLHSVQEDEKSITEGIGSGAWFMLLEGGLKAGRLPRWGSPGRQHKLRQLYYDDANTMVTSAIQQLIRRVKQSPWTIVGGPQLTKQYQKLMQESDFGDGFDTLISKLLVDYYTLDTGAVMEIVGPGEPDTPLEGAPVGLVALDGLRCHFTGNREFPVLYRSHRTNKLHKLHWTRVERLVDMPSPDPFYRGMGLCALSRAAMVAHAQILLMNQEVDSLTDQPANGIISFAGVSKDKLLTALTNYNDTRENNVQPILRNLLQLTSTDPANPVKVELIPFSSLPTGYSQEETIRNHINLLALAIGVDPQDLWPLASKSMGSGLQSEILHAKGQGKAYGDTLSLITRVFNISVLPRSLELQFRPRDGEREKQDADIANTWMSLATAGVQSGLLTPAQGAAVLANNVSAYADVLLDENGNLRVNDQDPKEDGQDPKGTPTAPPADAQPANGGDRTTTGAVGSTERPTRGNSNTRKEFDNKAIQATRLDFEGDLEDLLSASVDGEIARQRFGVVFRALVAKYGRKAYEDGLSDGGVQPQDASTTDYETVLQLTKAQSVYITGLAEAIFNARTVSAAMAAQKPEVWFNKSIFPFYEAGLASADRNGYYGWALGSTERHCTDCKEFADHHVHRLSEWLDAGWRPKSERLECKGFNCDCNYVKTEGPSMGTLQKRG